MNEHGFRPNKFDRVTLKSNDPLIQWPHFSAEEMRCKHCGALVIRPFFMDILEELRALYGSPLSVTSGYRCSDHPVEKAKLEPGTHERAWAADIRAANGRAIHLLLRCAFRIPLITGVGIGKDFVHLDVADFGWKGVRPNVWTYPL